MVDEGIATERNSELLISESLIVLIPSFSETFILLCMDLQKLSGTQYGY